MLRRLLRNTALILLISNIDVSSENPRRCLAQTRDTFTAVSGAITGDRNANSATKGRDVTRLRRERHAVPCDREKRHTQSPDPNNIHQQDIWCSRRSGASVSLGSVLRDVCELAACAEASSCLLVGGAGLSGKSRTATEITRLRGVFVVSDWQKSPRRNALT